MSAEKGVEKCMATRNIVKEGDPVLRKKSRPVEVFDERLFTLLDDMKDTLTEAAGIGLAAVQVGVLKRVFIVDTGESVVEFINPSIIKQSGKESAHEACLSCPGEYGTVTRPTKVRVRALNRFGMPFETDGEEIIARAFCHEYDHLDGVLYKDIATEMMKDEID